MNVLKNYCRSFNISNYVCKICLYSTSIHNSSYMVARRACTMAINELHGQKEQTTESTSLLDKMLEKA